VRQRFREQGSKATNSVEVWRAAVFPNNSRVLVLKAAHKRKTEASGEHLLDMVQRGLRQNPLERIVSRVGRFALTHWSQIIDDLRDWLIRDD
jgi:hypothetical protein